MECAFIDDVARMLEHKCRTLTNDPCGGGAGARRADGGAAGRASEGLLLRQVASSQAEASAEAHVEASAAWHMAHEYEQEGAGDWFSSREFF